MLKHIISAVPILTWELGLFLKKNSNSNLYQQVEHRTTVFDNTARDMLTEERIEWMNVINIILLINITFFNFLNILFILPS